MSRVSRNILGAGVIALLPVVAMAQVATETVSFQQGANYTGTTGNAYLGTVSMIVSDNPNYDPAAPVGPPPVVDGSTAGKLTLDAFGKDAAGVQNSWRRDVLLRFDNIIGDQPGWIPPGATILSARLQLFTTTNSNDQSPGPMGVARLLKPFNPATTTFNDPFGDNGPDWAEGDYDHWVGGYEGCAQAIVQVTPVTPVVQAWVNGETNHGFILRIQPSNAWSFGSQNNGTQARRPKLIVEFTRMRSRQVVFQQDVNGYTGTSMLRMQASTTTDPNGITTLGTAIGPAYLDGGENWTDGLIKFDGVFGTGPDQVAPDTTILRAFLALTTTGSSNAPSRGRYDFHKLLVDVDWAGDGSEPFLWTEFLNADGPTEADGEIGPTLVSTEGILWHAEPWIDITGVVQEWQSGQPNHGLIVLPGTSDNADGVTPPAPCTDGWEIEWLGGTDPTSRPKLILMVQSKGPDFNGDGHIDSVDLTDYFMPCASGPAIPYASGCGYADLDEDSDVDMDDFAAWQTCYSGTEPATQDCQ